jgi:hypothetical protein
MAKGKRRRRTVTSRRADDNTGAASVDAAPTPVSPTGESSPATNPYGPGTELSGGYETPGEVRAAGLSPELPFEAPDPDDADITYADGQTFFEKFPELLRGGDASSGS